MQNPIVRYKLWCILSDDLTDLMEFVRKLYGDKSKTFVRFTLILFKIYCLIYYLIVV